jgi:hypothetical protein
VICPLMEVRSAVCDIFVSSWYVGVTARRCYERLATIGYLGLASTYLSHLTHPVVRFDPFLGRFLDRMEWHGPREPWLLVHTQWIHSRLKFSSTSSYIQPASAAPTHIHMPAVLKRHSHQTITHRSPETSTYAHLPRDDMIRL